MKTQSTLRNGISLLLILISMNGFSQTVANEPEQTADKNKVGLTTLQNVVEGIREKNVSLKNADHINVMVNDLLIENLHDFSIDPKSIAAVEVLVLQPKVGSRYRIDPSIIINTKKIP